MSSGFFGVFAHAGVVSVLEDEGLRPARMCGSSAGALVGGLWASGVPARRLSHELLELRREHFWDVRPGLGLLRGALFRARLEALALVRTFEECRVPLAVSAFDVLAARTTVLRDGELAPALHASCAAPFMFQPVRIGARLYLDGGILDRRKDPWPGWSRRDPGAERKHPPQPGEPPRDRVRAQDEVVARFRTNTRSAVRRRLTDRQGIGAPEFKGARLHSRRFHRTASINAASAGGACLRPG